jgi:hypothetical protein
MKKGLPNAHLGVGNISQEIGSTNPDYGLPRRISFCGTVGMVGSILSSLSSAWAVFMEAYHELITSLTIIKNLCCTCMPSSLHYGRLAQELLCILIVAKSCLPQASRSTVFLPIQTNIYGKQAKVSISVCVVRRTSRYLNPSKRFLSNCGDSSHDGNYILSVPFFAIGY